MGEITSGSIREKATAKFVRFVEWSRVSPATSPPSEAMISASGPSIKTQIFPSQARAIDVAMHSRTGTHGMKSRSVHPRRPPFSEM
jgi:hypothetical protein